MTKLKERPPAYKGGFVREPVAGIHKGIVVLDFKSLYPSIIVTHNLDSVSLNARCPEKFKVYVPGFKGRWFCTNIEAKVPKRIKDLLEKRAEVKKLLNKKLSKEEKANLEKKEYQYKLAANIQYGLFGFAKGGQYNLKVAESISAFGRYYIQLVMSEAEKEELKVLYGDTDSIFLKCSKPKALRFLKKISKKLPGIIELEFRGVYKKGIFVSTKGGKAAKKRYALIDNKDQLLVRGFETRRGDWCKLSKETQEKVLKFILSDKKDKAVEAVKETVENLRKRKVKLSDLVISEQLSRSLEKYKATGPHTSAAQKLKDMGREGKEGTIIKYIIVQGKGSLSERAEPAESVKISDYDIDYYIEKQIIPPALRVLETFGINREQLV